MGRSADTIGTPRNATATIGEKERASGQQEERTTSGARIDLRDIARRHRYRRRDGLLAAATASTTGTVTGANRVKRRGAQGQNDEGQT